MIKDKGLCYSCNLNKIVKKNKCKPCYQKEYNIKNREKINIVSRIWATEHREQIKLYSRTPKAKFQNIRSSAKSRNLEFTINESEYVKIIQLPCYYCEGFFPSPECGGGLDRLNNNLGYHTNNVVSCCTICNQTRNNNWTSEETKIMIRAAINFKNTKLANNV